MKSLNKFPYISIYISCFRTYFYNYSQSTYDWYERGPFDWTILNAVPFSQHLQSSRVSLFFFFSFLLSINITWFTFTHDLYFINLKAISNPLQIYLDISLPSVRQRWIYAWERWNLEVWKLRIWDFLLEMSDLAKVSSHVSICVYKFTLFATNILYIKIDEVVRKIIFSLYTLRKRNVIVIEFVNLLQVIKNLY